MKKTAVFWYRSTIVPSFCIWISACTIQSSISSRYLTAEKLWSEKNYVAAVTEFDRIVKESPNSTIGLQALWRASMTRAHFLNDQIGALQGLELFLERASSSELAPEAMKERGEIYFNKLNQYSKAIEIYQSLLDSKKFSVEEQAFFTYRMARAYFLLGRLKKAIEIEEKFESLFPKSHLKPKVQLELAHAWYAVGESEKGSFQKALKIYQDLVKATEGKNPSIYLDARFGEAASLEELDQLERAYEIFSTLESTYPSPNVIQVRKIRLQERMAKKRKSKP